MSHLLKATRVREQKTESDFQHVNPGFDKLITTKLEDIDNKITTFLSTHNSTPVRYELEGNVQHIWPPVHRDIPRQRYGIDDDVHQQRHDPRHVGDDEKPVGEENRVQVQPLLGRELASHALAFNSRVYFCDIPSRVPLQVNI